MTTTAAKYAAKYTDIAAEITVEAFNALGKFGEQFDITNTDWLAILVEEVGEAAHELTLTIPNEHPGINIHLRDEVMQIGAVALRWIAAMDSTKVGT